MLQAPPGAGKTTRVPLALLDEPWLEERRIVMLEPRRLAARAAAAQMARLLGQRVGETVGYRVRLDTRVGPDTRIEVVTEGVLGRMLQDDPALEGVGLIIFDEFHERSVHADVGLAMTLQVRDILRSDLRILIMSATLDGRAVASLLGDAPIITSEGRAFPVETRYVPRRPEQWLETHVANTVRDIVDRDHGDVLVFLPGSAEIRRVASLLESGVLAPGVHVIPLHGMLPLEQQDGAIAPSPPRQRKVVLATSIAETSLTIDGVRVVVDSGVMRVPRFSPRSGMTRLETVRVSRASADQRRGRAGRTAAGVAYRLWAEYEDAGLVPHSSPEILETDLAPLALMLAAAGIADPRELAWLDAPPEAAYSQARELLIQLEALDADGQVTAHGRRMAELPMHPRLAHMVLAAGPRQLGIACDIAALIGERDILRRDGPFTDADLRLRLELVRGGSAPADVMHGLSVDRDAVRRAREQSREWRSLIARATSGSHREAPAVDGESIEDAGALLALAYPDRIAQRRSGEAGGRFLLRNGRGGVLPSAQALAGSEYIVVAELDDRRPEARVFLAAPVTLGEISETFRAQIELEDVIAWDRVTRSVQTRRQHRLGALILADAPLRDPDPGRVAAAFLEGAREVGAAGLPWSDDARRLRERIAFMARHESGWPDVSDAGLTESLDQWLAPHLGGMRRLDDLAKLDLAELVLNLLDWTQRRALDEHAPTHLVVPSGSRIPVDYSEPDAPTLSVRLQEMFGCTDTPRVGRGRVPVTIHLLSPAHRPVQVTRDLAGFWRSTYFDVRKDLRGRYPKHHWPDDPLTAPATSRSKRRS